VQSARYLVKKLLGARSGAAPEGSCAFLQNCDLEMKYCCEANTAKQWEEPAIQLAALR